LIINIVLTTTYHRQRDTIITWMDDETQCDLAISFQELEGAQQTWEVICNIQGKDPDEMSAEDASDEETIPLPKIDNLDELTEELQPMEQSRRTKILERMYENNEEFLQKLKDLFHTYDDLEAKEPLEKIFLMYKCLLNLADMRLFEVLMSDKYYLTVFGALEYNPEISNRHKESKHRKVSYRFKNKSKSNFLIVFPRKSSLQINS